MLKLAAYLTGFSSRSDGSAGLRFATQELRPEEFAELTKELNNFGWLIFSANQIKSEDIPIEHAEDKNKTPSKRLRAVLHVLWKQKGSNGDFEVYYRDQIEKIIDHIKDKLD